LSDSKTQAPYYISSGMHLQGDPTLKILTGSAKSGSSYQTYSDSKLHDLMLCLAVARKWPKVYANTVDPGWVPTKMGGSGAPDDLRKVSRHRHGWPSVKINRPK
jgi:NAD(P)-dependent dehydrogenase (short-subunit alcohol dehydrogenase family)